MNQQKMKKVAAGAPGQVYALGFPRKGRDYTIYRWVGHKFVALKGQGARSIAISANGLYITDRKNRILHSHIVDCD